MEELESRIESELEVSAYIGRMKHALDNGAKIDFQEKRKVDEGRDEKYTNGYTMRTLFPDEDPVDVLRRELKSLTVRDYMRTVKDTRFPKRSEMREFGKTYDASEEVYIKVRVEVYNPNWGGEHTAFVMSFHFAEKPFDETTFPYRKQ
ncbi:MAG: hypothetical protein IJO56_01825 [Oscillospiraceae bacterium]|nr:hypothetical protein [Oscillospiraceae bacterium]